MTQALKDRIQVLETLLDRQGKVLHATQALHSSLDLDELLELILQVAREGVDAERGTVFLLTEDGCELWSRVLSGDEALEIRLPLGQGIAGSVGETGETVRIDDAYSDARFDPSWDMKSGFKTRQILCAPIRNRHGKIVGVFQLLNKRAGPFTEDDEEFLAAVSIHAALAVENARLHRATVEKERQEREIKLAQGVQRQLQPERRIARAGPIVAAGFNELCEDATGDYYDFLIELPEHRLGVAIGDASGHGLQAAFVMANARALLRAFAATVDTLPEALDLLNDFLVPDLAGGRFMSLFTAGVDTNNGQVEWCNAGHNAPLHYRVASNEIRWLEATGRVLGVFEKANYRAGDPFVLEPGDVLLCYTDGVTEARSPKGELFESERLGKALKRLADRDGAGIVEGIREEVRAWTHDRSPNEDDITMVAVQRPVF